MHGRYAENAQALMLPAASSQGSRARRVHQDRPAHRRAGLTRSIRVDDSVAMARPRLPGVGCVCGTGQALTMIISALMAATAADGLLTQELTGPGAAAEWHVTNGNGSVNTKASVPGHVHLDLLAAGLIEDPYYRFEDKAQQWVALDSWTYTASFSVDPCFLAHNRTVVLAMEGVDTVADVVLNGHPLASVANQHVRFSLPLLGAPVTAGANTLEVRFKSAVAYAAERRASYPADIHTYDAPWANTENKTFVRKQQCDFGWDWGPALASAGIWRPASLVSYELTRLTGATSTTELHDDGEHWRVQVKIFLEYAPVATPQAVSLTVSLEAIASKSLVVHLPPLDSCASGGDTSQLQEVTASTVLLIPLGAVDRWWPNGHGKQPLYNMSVVLTQGPDVADQEGSHRQDHRLEGRGAPCSDSLDTLTRRVGFRTAELVREPDSDGIEYGSTFFLRINGRPIFAKGSSWVPADAFDSRLSRGVLRRLLGSAAEVRFALSALTSISLLAISKLLPLIRHDALFLINRRIKTCSVYGEVAITSQTHSGSCVTNWES